MRINLFAPEAYIVHTVSMKNLTLALDDDVFARVKEAAQAKGVSMNDLVVEILLKELKVKPSLTAEEFLDLVKTVPTEGSPYVWDRDEVQPLGSPRSEP